MAALQDGGDDEGRGVSEESVCEELSVVWRGTVPEL